MDIIERRYQIETRAHHVEVSGASEADIREALELLAVVRKKRRDAYVGVRDSIAAVLADGIVSPEASKAAQAAAAHRVALLDTPAFNYGQLANVRGVTPAAVRSAVSRNAERVIAPSFGGRTVLPAFQFNELGELREDVARVNTVLKADPAMEEWSRWAWWHSRTSFLSGNSPLDLLDSSPDRVLHAARRMAEANAA